MSLEWGWFPLALPRENQMEHCTGSILPFFSFSCQSSNSAILFNSPSSIAANLHTLPFQPYRYKCLNGLQMMGEDTLFCDGHSWNGSVPFCPGEHWRLEIKLQKLLEGKHDHSPQCHHLPHCWRWKLVGFHPQCWSQEPLLSSPAQRRSLLCCTSS